MSTDTPRPLKSEQLQATDEIIEVAPGILRTQLPANITGLGHVNMYVLEDERGVAVVDPGLPTKESWAALTDRLSTIGVPLKRVHSIIVTHSHPDHYGVCSAPSTTQLSHQMSMLKIWLS
jgi:glyoxylase-like metal-dependent hydrolase (beta-lactamase superfamily II)